ncbi:hypothetical protein [uncultured Methanolobus sp.]|uniref:hypothetical protein n=1 Tax=uncultured Methanolobus sp. TaxID=218300 RepID=UPI002AABD322|nr:hypothetical protein [uncultured Methanolobus sp.]
MIQLKEGDIVKHTRYGTGKVIRSNPGRQKSDVIFADGTAVDCSWDTLEIISGDEQ